MYKHTEDGGGSWLRWLERDIPCGTPSGWQLEADERDRSARKPRGCDKRISKRHRSGTGQSLLWKPGTQSSTITCLISSQDLQPSYTRRHRDHVANFRKLVDLYRIILLARQSRNSAGNVTGQGLVLGKPAALISRGRRVLSMRDHLFVCNGLHYRVAFFASRT